MDRLNQIKQEFSEKQNNFSEMLDTVEKQIVRTVLTKGYPHNVFPFEWELLGKGKLNSIEIESIPPKTMSDNFFRTHYDNKGQVILSEQWSFGKFRYITIYSYEKNIIKCFKWTIPLPADNDCKLESISLLEFENDKPTKKYEFHSVITLNTFCDYIYQDGILVEIIVTSSTSKDKHTFEYEKDKSLSRIIRTFSSEKSIQQIYPRVKWLKTDD